MPGDVPFTRSKNLELLKRYAKQQSRNGYVQHVNKTSDGYYVISDWYDADSTVASYENGREK